MCNHFRQAILRGERIPEWSIDQFSEIRIPIRFNNTADVFPDREGLVIRTRDGEPVVAPIHPKAMPVVLSPAEALALQKPLTYEELVLLERG